VFSGSAKVKPGGTAYFAIWLSASGGNVGGVTVRLVTSPTSATPHFTVCRSGHTKTCKITTLNSGQTIELQAAVAIPQSSTNGERVKLTAKTTSTTPKVSLKASGTITVTVPASPSAGSSLASSSGAAAGTGSFDTGTLGLASGSLPLVPAFPVTSRPGGNIGALLPSIPAVTPSPGTGNAPDGAAAARAASVGPLDRRLVGTQLIALAALCAAIGIVIAKLTLRNPRPLPSSAAGGGNPRASAGAVVTAADKAAKAGTAEDPVAGNAFVQPRACR